MKAEQKQKATDSAPTLSLLFWSLNVVPIEARVYLFPPLQRNGAGPRFKRC